MPYQFRTTPQASKLGAFVALSDVEIAVRSDLYRRRHTFAAGLDLVHQGQADQSCYILARG